MSTIVLGTLAALFVLVFGGLVKSVLRHTKQTSDLSQRLSSLEDRFYNPANYSNAFIRPTGKKKDDFDEQAS